MYSFPLTLDDLQKSIARETARISYPGSMSRGSLPVVIKGTKAEVEEYFVNVFPLAELWVSIEKVSTSKDAFDNWHFTQCKRFGAHLERRKRMGNPRNNKTVVAAKFLNTFIHQLMKYERFRPLWPHLHLPLDSRVFSSFRRLQATYQSAKQIRKIIGKDSAYSITYKQYKDVQMALLDLMDELNQRKNAEFKLTSRIELNYLWL